MKIIEKPECIIPGYDGFVPTPEEGSLIKTAWGGGIYKCVIGLSARRIRALAHLMPRDSPSGYVSQSASKQIDRVFRRRIITEVNPERVRSGDFIDVSGIVYPACYLQDAETCAPFSLYYHTPHGVRRPLPFPLGTHGFLYYHRGDPAHLAEAQLRFRVTTDDRQESFATGRDLLLPNGLPWAMSGPALATIPNDAFRLLELKVPIDQETSKTWHAVKSRRTCTVIRGVGEEFELRFGSSNEVFYVANGSDLLKAKPAYLFYDRRLQRAPYKGTRLLSHARMWADA